MTYPFPICPSSRTKAFRLHLEPFITLSKQSNATILYQYHYLIQVLQISAEIIQLSELHQTGRRQSDDTSTEVLIQQIIPKQYIKNLNSYS